ncbi:tyrosine-protein phosphatase [Geomonas edaphica]|uniref:tyrosine-protein phosphatase n=1 Tax=Geomonas edaphica TaxID=2570226 RepID=UPI0010A81375|nr:CpsB/CapC family capsule biosynthesis tyrosine phosphatase [Geomonas edaphica]
MEKDFTDYHCHIVPAVDDGATDLEESFAMARILSEFGFRTVVCTPHMIRGCFENNPARVTSAVSVLQGHLNDAGILLQLVPGCEHYLDEFLPELLLESVHARPEDRRMLVEVPFRDGPELLSSMVERFFRLGLEPLIAHPERCRAFEPQVREHGLHGALFSVMGWQKTSELSEDSTIMAMKRAGCVFQGNLGSFAGRYGNEVRERALLFLRHGLYSCIGSDAHRPEGLAEMLQKGKEAITAEVGEEAALTLLRGTLLQSR